MVVQSSVQNSNVSLASCLFYGRPLQPKTPNFIRQNYQRHVGVAVTCSISQVHSYGTVDFERRPALKWSAIHKKISLMENPEMGSGSVLNQWEREGRQLSKWELCRVVKELRKYKRYDRALEVYDWMNNRGERFRLSSSDAAIQLDLIAKVRGIASAENFFLSLSNNAKDRRIYGALLNAYVRAKQKEKAESLLNQMRNKGYITHCLPFNVMMTLYMNLKDYEKVDGIVSEMMEKKIQLDVYSYNIWLSCRGSQGNAERMEQVYEQMRLDETVNPNWTTFSTMATMYIKMGIFAKAEECLRQVESRIAGRDRIPYHYLLSLYGSVGNKEEIYRVWNVYKAVFPTVPNLGYHAMISSLLRTDDIEGAEKIYEEWLLVRSSYDPRIANLFMGYYVKKRNLERAMSFVDHIAEIGGKPNSGTWETLVEGHTVDRKLSKALFYWKEAFAAEGSQNWRPKAANVSAFFDLCDQEADVESKQVLVGLLKEAGYLKDEYFASQIGLPHEPLNGDGIKSGEGSLQSEVEVNKDDESDVILNQL